MISIDCIKSSIIAAVFFILTVDALHGVSLKQDTVQAGTMKVFYHGEDINGINAVVKGKIISLSAREDVTSESLSPKVQDKTKAGVRLSDHEGIKQGDMLYVINDKNLIVSRMEVKSVFYTDTFGYMLIGYGNFRIAKNGYRVVQRIEEQNSKYAYIYKSRGDYYQKTGETSESIKQYKQALELDKGNPGAHLELGYVYLKEELFQFAFKEFSEAYKSIARLYDNEDKYFLLKGLAETRYREAYHTTLPQKLKRQYIQEGIKYCKEALALYPDSTDINFYLGMFYYRNSEPSDKDARDHLLKVIDKDPENIEAHLILAEMYYNHKNKEKALSYAEAALKIDPANERARFIRKLAGEE